MILPHPLERLVVMASDGRWEDMVAELPDAASECKDDWSELLVRLAFYGRSSWIPAVIERGADPKFCTKTGDTALSECLAGASRRKPTFSTFVKLLQSGADPNEVCRGGNRVLQLAIKESMPEYAAILLLHGADPRLPSPDPDRPDSFRIARSPARRWAREMLERWCVEFPEKAAERLPDPWGGAPEMRRVD